MIECTLVKDTSGRSDRDESTCQDTESWKVNGFQTLGFEPEETQSLGRWQEGNFQGSTSACTHISLQFGVRLMITSFIRSMNLSINFSICLKASKNVDKSKVNFRCVVFVWAASEPHRYSHKRRKAKSMEKLEQENCVSSPLIIWCFNWLVVACFKRDLFISTGSQCGRQDIPEVSRVKFTHPPKSDKAFSGGGIQILIIIMINTELFF